MHACIEKELVLAYEGAVEIYENLKIEENVVESDLNELLKVKLLFF
jgi:hypothetical protein